MTRPSSNPSSSRDASTVAAASTRRFASRVDGRHTSLGHARKETTTTTTTTMRGTTTTTVASSSSSSLSSSTLVADARGRRAVSRCAVRRVDARREEPKIQPRRRTGTATTRETRETRETKETRERSSRAHRSTHPARHRHRANSVVFETPVATTKQTTRETRPAALGVRSSSRASTRRTDDDARDRRDVDAIARGRRREDENRDAEDALRDDDGEDDASFRAAAAARDPAVASRDDARARDHRATPASLPSDEASLLQEERDALRSAYELVVAERDDARAIRELARNAERDAARRLEASRRHHDARARHLRRAIDVIEHLRHGRATGEDVDDFLRACRRETERNDDDNVSHECLK